MNITGADVINHMQRRILHTERRPQIRNAADIMGPGFGPRAVRLMDWNDDVTLFSGLFYSEPGALNSPDPSKYWMGLVEADPNGFGYQRVMEYRAFADPTVVPTEYVRTMTSTGLGEQSYGPWLNVKSMAAIRYDMTAATITVGTTVVTVTNWSTLTYAVGDITYAAGIFTLHTPGVYRWDATVLWPAAAAAYRVTIGVQVNGSLAIPGQQTMNFASGFGQQVITSGFTVRAVAGDTLALGLLGSTGGIAGVQPYAFAITRDS